MQTQNPLLDDLARVVSSAVGVAAGMRSEVEAQLRQRLERILGQMDLVSREEFEVVRAMAAKARDEQEALNARVAALEAELAARPGTGSRRKAAAKRRKPAAGKTGAE